MKKKKGKQGGNTDNKGSSEKQGKKGGGTKVKCRHILCEKVFNLINVKYLSIYFLLKSNLKY